MASAWWRSCIAEGDYVTRLQGLALARCGLAEAQGRLNDLATELPKAIAYLKWQIRYNTLFRKRLKAPPFGTAGGNEAWDGALRQAELANEELAGELRRAERKLHAVKRALRRAARSE